MADLVTRLRLDDKQFNENIKKSKKQLNDFEKVATKVGKSVSKAFIALEAVKAVVETFSFAIDSSSEASKQFSTTLSAAKTSVSNFFSSLISGNWKPFQNGMKESIKLAKEFADAQYNASKMNEYGTSYADYIEGKRNNLEYIITSDNSTAEEKKAAQEEYAKLAEEEISVRNNIVSNSYKAISDGLKTKGIKSDYSIDELQRLIYYVNDSKNVLTEEQRAFKDLFNNPDLKPYIDAIVINTDKIGTIKKDLDDSISDLRDKTQDVEVKTDSEPKAQKGSLGYINNLIDEKETQFSLAVDPQSRIKLRQEIEALEKEKHYIEMEPTMLKPLVETKTTFGKDTNPLEGLNMKKIDMDDSMSNFALGLADSMNLAGQAMYGLGSAFQAFSDNAAVGKAGLILGAIGQLVMGYATATAQAAKLGPWAWIGFAATGLGVLATTISQIKGFADGGIVDSPYTTGDRNLIKVNGGEMILTKGQQANLFSVLQHGTTSNGGGQVTFKIQGKELVGVLNNYNNKVSKVL